MTIPVLQVDDLTTEFETKRGRVRAVDGVSLALHRGEVLGLVGESGSGKSQTGYSLMNLVDAPGRVVGGRIALDGLRIDGLNEAQWRGIRGKRIAMVFQDPMLSLNPVLRIDTQMIEAVQAHLPVSRTQAREMAREALTKVGIAAPDERLNAYPHQFSGGMRQRVAIAIALLHRPDVLIADEPTTALDVTIQEQILYEVQKLAAETGTAVLWITHDLSVVAGLADSIAVMYAGRIVERGPARDVLDSPAHPYTAGLMKSAPARNQRGAPLYQIPGNPPNLLEGWRGCAFGDRCPLARKQCDQEPAATLSRMREVRCFFPLVPVTEVAIA